MSTLTTNYSLIKSTIGGRTNEWGQDIHDSYDIIDTQLKANADAAAAANTAANERLVKTANLSDVADPAVSRANLQAASTTEVNARLAKTANLSDVADPAVSRANLGADNASNLTTGALSTSLTSGIEQIAPIRVGSTASLSTSSLTAFVASSECKLFAGTGVHGAAIVASASSEIEGGVDKGEESAIVGGSSNLISGVRDNVILGGNLNTLGSRTTTVLAGSSSAIVGGSNNTVGNNANRSVILGGRENVVSQDASAAMASDDCDVSSPFSACIASQRSYVGYGSTYSRTAVIASSDSKAGENGSVVLASVATENGVPQSLALGTGTTGSTSSTANRKIHLFAQSGNVDIAGTLSSSASFADVAEMFPNGVGAELHPGTLLTLDGGSVRPANAGEDICGVVSHTAALRAGDTPFEWQGRHLKDEFGRIRTEEVLDKRGAVEKRPIVNPEYDPGVENIPRSKRPTEWVSVGLLGQVYVRTGQAVAPGDKLSADGGKGYVSPTRTGVRVMKETKAFDGDYGVALCLINVQV